MRRDEAYLLDMLLAAHKARQFVEGMTLEKFAASELHQYAVIRPLEIIGEAAARISPEAMVGQPYPRTSSLSFLIAPISGALPATDDSFEFNGVCVRLPHERDL